MLNLQLYRGRIASIAGIAVVVFVVIMALYSSIGSGVSGVDSSQGLKVVNNRVFGNADGLEYFLAYEKDFKPSPFNFIKYNFVIIMKRVTGEQYDNLGRHLYQDALGQQVDFGGANFTILLQARIIAGALGFLYVLTIVVLFYWSRQIIATRGTLLDIVLFNLSYGMVWFFVDSEAQFARLGVTFLILGPLILICFFVERWSSSIRILRGLRSDNRCKKNVFSVRKNHEIGEKS